jgi:hypothetical protein
MVQALAFAEIFLGLILADAGYKGASVSQVVKGEAGKGVEPAALGSAVNTTSTSVGSGGAETVPAGGAVAITPQEAARGKAFGPSPLNNSPVVGGFNALSPQEQKEALAEGARG